MGILKSIIMFFSAREWFLHVCVTLFVMLVAILIIRSVLQRLKIRGGVWQQAVLEALHKPIYYFVLLYGGCLIVEQGLGAIIIQSAENPTEVIQQAREWSAGFDKARSLLTVVMLLWFVWRFIANVEQKFVAARRWETQNGLDRTSLNALSQVSRIAFIIVGLLLLLQAAGISISALLAFGGVGALAVSLAAKDTLANIIGGLMIFWDRPFSVGDWVRSPDQEMEGTVEHIGWRLTTIRTFDMRCLYVPNALFSTVSIENPSRMTNRRIKQIVGVRYDDAESVHKIIQDVESMLRAHPEIDDRQTMFVNLIEFSTSSLNFMVYTFTKTVNWVEFQAIQQDVMLKILDIVRRHGAQCAFPTMTLDFSNSAQPLIDKQEFQHD